MNVPRRAVGRTLAFGVLAVVLGRPLPAIAKGDGRGFVLEGTIARPEETAQSLRFALTGDLLVTECRRGRCVTSRWESNARIVVKADLTGTFFVAMTPDGHGGAVLDPRTVIELVRDAAAHGHRCRLELANDAAIRFGGAGKVVEIEAQVIRMTDHHLQDRWTCRASEGFTPERARRRAGSPRWGSSTRSSAPRCRGGRAG